jgi:hypothetical protein
MFETEVIMQAPGIMLVNDKYATSSGLLTAGCDELSDWFCGLLEISLLPIVLKTT